MYLLPGTCLLSLYSFPSPHWFLCPSALLLEKAAVGVSPWSAPTVKSENHCLVGTGLQCPRPLGTVCASPISGREELGTSVPWDESGFHFPSSWGRPCCHIPFWPLHLDGCLQIKLESQRGSVYVYRGTAAGHLVLTTTLEGGGPCLRGGKSRLREVK